MKTTDNYKKHRNKNPIQKFLIKNFYSNLISIVKDLEPKNILDAGCGEGFTLNTINKNKIKADMEGIDYSKDSIELGKQIYPYLKLEVGDIYNLAYKENFFDLVLCTEVLEHLKNPEKALKEIDRVSKKYCILSVPNEPFFMMSNFFRGKNVKRLGNDIEHINHWTAKGFEKFIKKNSRLKVIKTSNPFPWTLVLCQK